MLYKPQILCIIILLYLGIMYIFDARRTKVVSKWYIEILIFSIAQISFDILSVYTVNRLDEVSPFINRWAHNFYMGFLVLLFYVAYKYLEQMAHEEVGVECHHVKMSYLPCVIGIVGMLCLPLDYVQTAKGNYSWGPAVYPVYGGIVAYIFFIMWLLHKHGKVLQIKKKKVLMVSLLSEVPVALIQAMAPTTLISSFGVVLLNLGIYVTMENPDAVLVEMLDKEKKRADVANKAKTNFLANMSHEIRTPINTVLGMNEMILRESKETQTINYAKDVEGAAKSLLNIINDILDITKIEAGKLTILNVRYDISSVLHDAISMIDVKAKMKDLKFEACIDEKIPSKLQGDDVRLRQILVNLLSNAVKYTAKGKVTLKAECVRVEEDNAWILFSVMDTGIGIKKEDIQKMCNPFERIEEKRNRNIEGTGLGMTIVSQLLALLKSELKIESEYGKGSEFSFVLKQKVLDATPIGQFGERANEGDKGSAYSVRYQAPDAKVLVVDDNEMNLKVFCALLKGTKVQIDTAESGVKCLEMVKQKKYDIIFMDHMMPDMDGVETFQIMKEMEDYPCKNTPIVILTANAIVGARESYLEMGFDAFLSKPIDYKRLERLIERLLDNKLLCYTVGNVVNKEETVAEPELLVVDGLDWDYAQNHFEDKESMLEMVKFFASTIEYEAKALEELVANVGEE